MTSDLIVAYDGAFLRKFTALKAALEAGDVPALQRFLIDEFGFLFRMNQRYWKLAGEGGADAFDGLDEELRRELMRPLSHRQYRMIERALRDTDDDLAVCAAWDFLHDEGAIYHKRVMSPAEIAGFSLIYEEACVRLHRP